MVPITSAAKPFSRALRRRPDFDGIAGDECRGVHRLHGRMGDMIAHIVGLDSRFTVSGHYAHAVLRTLPPIVHITKESEQAALRWAVERMMLELREPQPGGFLVAQHLAHMMLLQSLRLHLADGMGNQVGWFPALADRQICAAITAMHRARLSLEFARTGRTSRYAAIGFRPEFKATVGETPMDYLTRWRMTLAADRLENSGDPFAAIAFSLGYESESSFSAAFKRVMGCSPRQYGRKKIAFHLRPGRSNAGPADCYGRELSDGPAGIRPTVTNRPRRTV
ncbi:AraC family transcriptional regulator [Sinorhizobium meliloti]|nr:helix-turn-helix domain-containing protein [Sinorhizobium meliloti]MDW9705453.1 helix-turn-helix domain-containing protein [Sinorhizobium meliloti]MDW9736947.1 helix-turn-helix domain-containing protein [Sinorhizobium meliloti]MDW9772115.1 helix-turn-helix domain-containing protein [Sinorhizobium meliloti]MDW9846514.1 helix-turn-helix domain-containing protein [Sinorhizobium meliloti]